MINENEDENEDNQQPIANSLKSRLAEQMGYSLSDLEEELAKRHK